MFRRILNKFDKNSVFIMAYAGWGCLGFYRGVQLYNFDYQKDMENYKKDSRYREKPEQFYISKFGMGLLITGLYIIPPTFMLVAIKELYRLEINLRGLNEKKENRDYYTFFP